MIKGIEHIGICASDTDALKEWYARLFGFKIAYENNKTPKTYFLLVNDGSMIEIYPSNTASESCENKVQGIRHLALIPEDFDKVHKVLIENAVEIVEDAKSSSTGVKTLFFRDLEGNIIHLIDRSKPFF